MQSYADAPPIRERRTELRYTIRTNHPEPDHAFGYGMLDGSRGVSKEPFQHYLQHSVDEERLVEQLREVEGEVERWQQQENRVLELKRDIAATTRELEHLEEHLKKAEERVEKAEADHKDAEEERKKTASRGSLLFFLLYCAAGALFIGGDIVMARQTVSEALDLGGWESWVFALGLAMLAVLLKPAYDRLVEEPYVQRHERGTRLFAWTIILTAFLVLITLAVLGFFRSEAFIGNAEMAAIEENESLSVQEQLEKIQEVRSNLLSSQWGVYAFIATSILFAMAGAICLGIGLRHVQDWYHIRVPNWLRRWNTRRAVAAAREAAEHLNAQISEREQHVDQLRAETETVYPLDQIRAELDRHRAERRNHIDQLADARREKLYGLYRDGYNLGELDPDIDLNGAPAAPHSGASRGGRQERPYVALRRAIRANAITPPDLPKN